ncbi:hypothetical protein [Kitasatospora sp. NPDC094015]|uniref:hypothetical protein n=1 Tax=Kitasatospora sp. NPDC094015 TaxID=3155205 RepID=UPI003331A8B4
MSEEQQSQPVAGQPPQQPGQAVPPQGYGYPPQQPVPGQAVPAHPGQGAPVQGAQPGYGYPPQQPGFPGQPATAQTPPPYQAPYNPAAFGQYPGGQPPVEGRYGPATFQNGAEEPDWSAMAARHEAEGRKKKRTVAVAVALLATVALAGIAAVVIHVAGKDEKPDNPAAPKVSSGPSTPGGKSGTPSAQPTSPEAALAKAGTDTAPMTVDTLFPEAQITVDGRAYTRGATEFSDLCGNATNNGLGAVLDAQKCRGVYLATYVSDGAVVTVGVAVFDSKGQADKAEGAAAGNVKVLVKDTVPKVCPDVTKCDIGHKAIGRYVSFTTSGNRDLSPSAPDKPAPRAAADVQKYVLGVLTERGRAAMKSSG